MSFRTEHAAGLNLALVLDISTSSTGYAIYDRKSKQLMKSGRLKLKHRSGSHKWKYPKAALFAVLDMSNDIGSLIEDVQPNWIVIEEVNRGINRIGQKSLDACHFFVLSLMNLYDPTYLDRLTYVDSNGKKGWRGMLGLKLSEQDKQVNAEIRLHNRKRKKSQKAPVIDWKVLAQRYVNTKFKTQFNVWENAGDDDEVDAIALGDAFVLHLDKGA